MGTGDVNNDFALTRLQTDGSIDQSIGTGGTVGVDFGGFEFDGDVALQPNGQIVIAGSTNVNNGGDMAIARLNGDPVGGGGGPPPQPITVTLHTPASPLVAGQPSQFVAVPNGGPTISHYDWDLNGDGKTDAQCNGATPILDAFVPKAFSGPVKVTAVGRDGQIATASTFVTFAPAAPINRTRLLNLNGSKINRFLLPRGVASSYPTATCTRPAGTPGVDDTAGGGPGPNCNDRFVAAGLVEADGCFKVVTPPNVPKPERDQLAGADYKFAQSLLRAGAARDGPSPQAHAAVCPSCKLHGEPVDQLGMFGTPHVATQAVRINGLDYVPERGSAIVLQAGNGILFVQEAWLVGSDVSVQIAGVQIVRGPLTLNVGLTRAPVHITDFDTEHPAKFAPGLSVVEGTSSLDLIEGQSPVKLPGGFQAIEEEGQSQLRAHLGLPAGGGHSGHPFDRPHLLRQLRLLPFALDDRHPGRARRSSGRRPVVRRPEGSDRDDTRDQGRRWRRSRCRDPWSGPAPDRASRQRAAQGPQGRLWLPLAGRWHDACARSVPVPGTLECDPAPGSSAIVALRRSFALREPAINLTRRPGRGGRIVYGYRVKPIRGQQVTLLEEVGHTPQQRLVVHRSPGTLSFFPSSASGTRRKIVAVVAQDGHPRTDVTVARFVAQPTRPARPPTYAQRGGLAVSGSRGATRRPRSATSHGSS